MSLRSLATVSLVGLLCLSGCLGGLTPTNGVKQKAFPDHSPAMDGDTAGPYIAAYEEVYRHNLTVEEATETIQEIVVGAGVVSVNESGDGDEVVVYVEFFWTYVGDGTDQPSAIVDGQPYEATYFVNETTTNRRGDTLE